MQRVVLFILTNLAVILILTGVLRLLGVDRILDEQGIDPEMTTCSSSPLEERVAALAERA